MKKEITLHPVKRNGLESLVIELALIKENIYIDNTYQVSQKNAS